MKKDCNESIEIIVPLGQALRDARLVASLSTDDVADKLNLSSSTIADIEDNLAQMLEAEKYPIIYLRGYLVNYAKLVSLNTLELFVEYQQLVSVQKQKKVLLTSKLIMPLPKKHSKIVSFSLFLAVALGVGFYLLPKESSSTVEQHPVISESVLEPSDVIPAVKLTEEKASIDITTPTPVTATIVENPVVQAVQTLSETVPSAIVEVLETVLPSTDKILEQPNEEQSQAMVSRETLVLSFADECWAEVFDATGERIAFGLYKKGRVLKLSGVAPFQLKLGDPSVVEIQYRDQTIKGEFTPGRSAHFSVPAS